MAIVKHNQIAGTPMPAGLPLSRGTDEAQNAETKKEIEMARKVFIVGFINEWGNLVELFRGTETQCGKYYEENIEECEEWDAIISPL